MTPPEGSAPPSELRARLLKIAERGDCPEWMRQTCGEAAAALPVSQGSAEPDLADEDIDDEAFGYIVDALGEATNDITARSACACGTTLVCPDIGCDLHKAPLPEPPPQRTDWRPIASAKEGVRVLAWYPIAGTALTGKPDDGLFYGPGGEEPTHWQPLPAPPLKDGTDGE